MNKTQLWLCALALAANGCSPSGSGSAPGQHEMHEPSDGSDVISVRKPDQVSNGSVTIDEAGLHASVHDRTLALSIPVRAEHGGEGSLEVALLRVDGSKTLSETHVSYALDPNSTDTLEAELALPDDVHDQADRVLYSVRVRGASDATFQVTRSLLYLLSAYDVRLEGPAKLHAGKRASYRVRALDAIDQSPRADIPVSLVLQREGQADRSLSATTDETGSAAFDFQLDDGGDYKVSARAGEPAEGAQLEAAVHADAPGQKLLVTTDKPLYQPGQTMHLRALSLLSPDNRPNADTELVFEVFDGKGNKVLKKRLRTNEYGIVSHDFQLASAVNMGAYKVRASAGALSGEKTVEVSRYVLPKFALDVVTDKPWYLPGSTVAGSVSASYFFGKSVSPADVLIEALTLDVSSSVFARVIGQTDGAGNFPFSLELPSVLAGIPLQNGNGLVTLRVQLTDSAGQVVSKEVALTVAQNAVQISLVPEATALVPRVDNRLQLFVTDPLGAPMIDTRVTIRGAGDERQLNTDVFGHAQFSFQPGNTGEHITVEVAAKGGARISRAFEFKLQTGAEHVLVRTDKSVYQLGETVHVQLLAAGSASHAYVDWQNDGQSSDMRTLKLDNGAASFDVSLDTALLGENRIDAYVVDSKGNSTRAGRTILVNREATLKVALSQDKQDYKPGETAKLTFSVTDSKGAPAAAALGVQIVDEAVFGLIDARPGLLRTFFELEDAFAKPSYELQAPPVSFETLLFERVNSPIQDERDAAQAMAEAQLGALLGQHMLGVSLASWPATLNKTKQLLTSALESERMRLRDAYGPLVEEAAAALAAMGCNTTAFCVAAQKSYLQALGEKVLTKAPTDFWGNAYQPALPDTYPAMLRFDSKGPDERASTSDDISVVIDLAAFGVTPPTTPVTSGPAHGLPSALPSPPVNNTAPQQAGMPTTTPTTPTGMTAPKPDNAKAESEPRVRKSFPETLYTNAAVITDGSGKVTVDVPLADSITSWRVSSLANSRSGQLGGGQAGVTVFQDFFVDVNFPAELTRGDQVEFPVVVYNYRNTVQSVRLELEASPWFTALGPTTLTLELSPSAVQSVLVPVRIERAGQQTLTVRAFGESVSDAVQRSIRVVPDGTRLPIAQSGSLKPGSSSLKASFPKNTVDGSTQLMLDVYPGLASQAVQGLDNMLQVPGGCFEQTTATTWPNVLVSQYLDATHQTTPEVQLKADSYISAGYQRLLTYEHQSGGFSWFGERDKRADISVTAFGLMEFADMTKVHEVDPSVISRTQTWLASQQASDGSWMGGMTEFFSFQTSTTRNTSFVVWALAQSGFTGPALQNGLEFIKKNLSGDEDAYTLALAANAFGVAAPNDAALAKVLGGLDKHRKSKGEQAYWDAAGTQTNFYSMGRDSEVATTAMVVHALMLSERAQNDVQSGLQYLISAKDASGNFGSTQASVWALKALLLAAAKGSEKAVGSLDVSVDGQPFKTVALTEDQSDVTTRLDMTSLASLGDHTVALSFTGKGQLSYNLISGYNLPWTAAPNPNDAPLRVEIKYDRTSLVVNDSVTAEVQIQNMTKLTQNMLLVSVGIPPGFELVTDQLDAALAAGPLARYEQTGKQLILYITQLPSQSVTSVQYRLRATMPVRAADGGAQVYLYYQPEQRAHMASTMLVATGS